MLLALFFAAVTENQIGIAFAVIVAIAVGLDPVLRLVDRFRGQQNQWVTNSAFMSHCKATENSLATIQKDIEVNQRQRGVESQGMQTEIRLLTASVSTALQDNARAIGRLEGSQTLAAEIARALKS